VTIAEYVEAGIRGLMLEVAEMVASGEIDCSPDEAAGVPLFLFRAECDLVAAWRRIVSDTLP